MTLEEEVDYLIKQVSHSEDAIQIDLIYPRHRSIKAIEVGLEDVRAADSIRIEYDFDRDGYVIKQASRFWWLAGEPIDQGWTEVAFVQAWALDPEKEIQP